MHLKIYCFLWICKQSYWHFQLCSTNMNYWSNQFIKEINHLSNLKRGLRYRNLASILHWIYQKAFRLLLESWSSKYLNKKRMLRSILSHNSIFNWKVGLVITQSQFIFVHLAYSSLHNQSRIFSCLYLKIGVRWLLWWAMSRYFQLFF